MVAALPTILVALVVVNSLRVSAENNFRVNTLREIRQVDAALEIFFDRVSRNVRYIASSQLLTSVDSSVRNYLAPGEYMMDPVAEGGVEAEVYSLFDQFATAQSDHAYAYMGLRDGGYVQWPKGAMSGPYDPRVRPWYRAAMDKPGQPVRTPAYYWEPDDAVIVSTVMTVDNRQGHQGGVVGLDVSLGVLTGIVGGIRLGESGYLMLLEDSGNVLVDSHKPEHNFKNIRDIGAQYQPLTSLADELASVVLDGTTYMVVKYSSPGLGWHFIGLIEQSEVMAQANRTIFWLSLSILLMAGAFSLLGWAGAGYMARPIEAVSRNLRDIAQGDGDLTAQLPINGKDEIATLSAWFNQFLASIRSLIERVKSGAGAVSLASTEATSLADTMNEVSARQESTVHLVSAAIGQMAASANEVAQSCSDAAEAASRGYDEAQEGQAIVDRAVAQVQVLNTEIQHSVAAMTRLEADSRNIDVILSTIIAIAEQTNLLALNAAIEAARAGEQGRGFAVVADEVRALAKRTANSTTEVGRVLQQLNSRTQDVSQRLHMSSKTTEVTARSIDATRESFEKVLAAVESIRGVNIQIATAAEQQHQVAEEINRYMTEVHGGTMELGRIAQQAQATSESLANLSRSLHELVGAFRT